MEEAGGFLVQRPQTLLLTVAALVLLVLRNGHACPLGQGAHRIRIAQSLHFHLEVDHTAALVAAEAIIHSLIGSNREGGGLFPVEGAKSKQIGTGTAQVHILPHHILNGIAGDQLVNECRLKIRHGPTSSLKD